MIIKRTKEETAEAIKEVCILVVDSACAYIRAKQAIDTLKMYADYFKLNPTPKSPKPMLLLPSHKEK